MALTQDQAGNIANSLIDSEGLRLPARLSEGPAPAAEKTKYLHALLEHDPGVFLERHGKLISKEQRAFFEPLRDSSYEVDFYLKLLEDEDQMDQMEGPASSTAKNRRLAKMTRLAKEGYFDEDVARKRAPLLHHHYLGQQPSSSQSHPRPSTLHDQIIQQHEEQEVRARMAAQRQEEDAAGEAFEATLTESESESEDSAEDDDLDIPQYEKHQQSSLDPAGNLTEDDIQQNKEEFQAMMKERFLNGEDGGKDADNDSSLDDDWTKEQTQDIEDEYFET